MNNIKAFTTSAGQKISFLAKGDVNRPTLVLGNGIGVDIGGFEKLQNKLAELYHVITWAYRGVGESAEAIDGDYSMQSHAKDGLALIEHLALDRPFYLGWSMGVQVGLEMIRLQPNSFSGFISLLGGFGQPFDHALPKPAAHLLKASLKAMRFQPKIVQRPLDFAARFPRLTTHVFKKLGLVDRSIDRDIFAHNIRSVARVDRDVYLKTLIELTKHQAVDMLSTIDMPCMVIAGKRDGLTPTRVARDMANALNDAEYHELEGTHFALLEEDARVIRFIKDFIRKTVS